MLTEDQIKKLPKSVQTEINTLTMRLNEAKKELNRLNENPPSNTYIGYHQSGINPEPTKYLKNSERVTFCLEDGEIQVHVINTERVEVHAVSYTNNNLVILPKISNGFEVSFI